VRWLQSMMSFGEQALLGVGQVRRVWALRWSRSWA